ncbi:histone-lysine N-methyltransferase SETMAR [Trichonephila clavipes]|nr:histone-lysine N-methyltransferase SETMAR [Trichonephila clavipes]
MHHNVKRHRTESCPSDPPALTLKTELHPKVLLSVWRDLKGIVHWGGHAHNQTINAAFYCLQLDRLHSNLVAKRPDLINHHTHTHSVILHHNNTRPHAAVITPQKLMGFG